MQRIVHICALALVVSPVLAQSPTLPADPPTTPMGARMDPTAGQGAHMAMSGMPMSGKSMSDKSMPGMTTPGMNMPGMTMPGMNMPGMRMAVMEMASSIDLLDPMNRESSGTAWVPDSTPMYGKMRMFGGNMLMMHGAAWPRYTHVGSARGGDKFDAPNWGMAMLGHPLTKNSQLGLRLMMSLDPVTESKRGYPLLFQTGETAFGLPLHDRQHPHDLFAELSATYSRALAAGKSVYLYAGYPGEPALGPPTFMHRLAAMDDPDAPIGHHWEDSTHISFGVLTAGAADRNVKVEGSLFTGREPDEYRYNFDPIRLDSYSGRVSWNPAPNLALQVSHGFIRSPEALDPATSVHRTTASAVYNRPLGGDANWSNSLIWGQNADTGGSTFNAFLEETDYQRGANTWYFRGEQVQKSGQELVLPEPALQVTIFNVGAYTAGYVRDLRHGSGVDMGLGGQVTFNTKPAGLNVDYGSGTPLGFEIFLRIRPSRMDMAPGHRAAEATRAVTGAGIEAAITPDPPKVGTDSIDMMLKNPASGQPMVGASLHAAVSMTTMNMGISHPAITDTGGGHYQLKPEFTMAGPWQVTITGTLPGGKKVQQSFDYAVLK